MKGRPIAIAAASCIVVFILTTYWWHTTNDAGSQPSLSSLLAQLKTTIPTSSLASAGLFPVSDRVAVIVETRPLRALIPLILHFASVLGPEWPILLFTRASTVRILEAFGEGSQPFKRMVKSGQVKIIELPTQASLQYYEGIAHFLASEWFWIQLEPAERMLLFQSDAIICANSGRQVEDFFEYDFVGAPHPYVTEAFNGGLSLRNVSLSHQVVKKWDIAEDIVNGTGYGLFDDVWFWDRMKELGGRFPTRDRASEFAVDYTWAERPLGYHGVNKAPHESRLEDIYTWCPEAALAANSTEVVELNEDEQNRLPTLEDVETEGGKHLSFGN